MKTIKTTAVIMLLSLGACSTTPPLSGSAVLLAPKQGVTQTLNAADVAILLQTPQQYDSVALLTASAQFSSYTDVAKLEAELLEELRRQAAASGANGVIDIVREVIQGDKVISITNWGMATRSDFDNIDNNRTRHLAGSAQQQSVVSSGYLVIYRGKGIRYTEN